MVQGDVLNNIFAAGVFLPIMIYKLGKNVEIGNKIMIGNSWHTIVEKLEDRVVTDRGVEVWYGNTIYGWKIK